MRLCLLSLVLMLSAFSQEGALRVKDDKAQLASAFKLSSLVQDYARIFEKNLSMPEKFKDSSIKVFGPRTLPKNGLEDYVSFVLYDAGYALLKDEKTNSIEVIEARDVRYLALPTFDNIGEVPDSFNYAKFVYVMKHISSHDLARNLRPFMSRYGRVIDGPEGKSLIISDTGKNIHRVYELLKIVDTAEFQRSKAAVEKINQEGSLIVKKDKGLLNTIKDQHILFIIAFSMIFGIIGFTLRGYMIKRIEGGW